MILSRQFAIPYFILFTPKATAKVSLSTGYLAARRNCHPRTTTCNSRRSILHFRRVNETGAVRIADKVSHLLGHKLWNFDWFPNCRKLLVVMFRGALLPLIAALSGSIWYTVCNACCRLSGRVVPLGGGGKYAAVGLSTWHARQVALSIELTFWYLTYMARSSRPRV